MNVSMKDKMGFKVRFVLFLISDRFELSCGRRLAEVAQTRPKPWRR